jgi:hypothetical protein
MLARDVCASPFMQLQYSAHSHVHLQERFQMAAVLVVVAELMSLTRTCPVVPP